MSQLAGQAALDDRRTDVSVGDVDFAIERAIEKAQQNVMDAYVRATSSARTSIRPHVLLASALAPTDEFGSSAQPTCGCR